MEAKPELCCICARQGADIIFFTCNHLCLCKNCAKKEVKRIRWQNIDHRLILCPICKDINVGYYLVDNDNTPLNCKINLASGCFRAKIHEIPSPKLMSSLLDWRNEWLIIDIWNIIIFITFNQSINQSINQQKLSLRKISIIWPRITWSEFLYFLFPCSLIQRQESTVIGKLLKGKRDNISFPFSPFL